MAYLDTYCMSVCFPEEYSRKAGGNNNDQQQQGEVRQDGGNTDDSAFTPSLDHKRNKSLMHMISAIIFMSVLLVATTIAVGSRNKV